METVLLNGRFDKEEAEQLLANLFKVKTDFHEAKISLGNLTAEEIAHSERRIAELQEETRRIITIMNTGKLQHVALHAKLVLEFCPDYFNGTE
ncbi:MAG: hypothetical protein EBZ77_04185 [Chitinophagia bacterium]|nr:hypothetical protein [Chitinophagia bacterium]